MSELINLKKFWKGKKVFITGHTGFKGSWMCILLNMLGAKIYGYSLKPNKKSLFNQAKCRKFLVKNTYANVKNFKFLNNQIKRSKPDLIFHLAAQPLVSEAFLKPHDTFKTNVEGTLNILESIKTKNFIKSVVIITTDKVYKIKNSNKIYNETDMLGGIEPYSVSKVCAELISKSYIETYFKNTNLRNRVSTARSGNVIGGGDYSLNRLIPDILKSKNSKKQLVVRNPNHIRPWQHVIEPTLGYLMLAEAQYKGKLVNIKPCWNFGPNHNNFVKVRDIINLVKKKINIKIKLKKDQKFHETSTLKLDSKKSKKILNWYPKWNLRSCIENILEWDENYKKNKNVKKICENQIIKYFK